MRTRRRLGGYVELLERPQLVRTAAEHLAQALLLLRLGDGVVGLVDLDRRRQRRGLDGADEVPAQADARLEEVAVALDLLWAPAEGRLVRVQRGEVVRDEGLVREDEEKLVLLQDLDLRDVGRLEDPLGHRTLDLAIQDEDAAVRTKDELARAV